MRVIQVQIYRPRIGIRPVALLRPVYALLFLVVVQFATCQGAFAAKGVPDKPAPLAIHISSDHMEASEKTGTVVFTGHVVARKGDLTIYADRLEVFYEKKKAATGDKKKKKVLQRIVATGHVKVLQAGRVGTGAKAIYDKRHEKVILSGSAQVTQGSNRISGDKITLFLNEDRSVAEGSKHEKVEAIVYPSE